VIERQSEEPIGAKAVGFSHADFGLVVQALHDPTGDQLLSPEVVKNSDNMFDRVEDLVPGGAKGLCRLSP
jgi:hypothetical protein